MVLYRAVGFVGLGTPFPFEMKTDIPLLSLFIIFRNCSFSVSNISLEALSGRWMNFGRKCWNLRQSCECPVYRTTWWGVWWGDCLRTAHSATGSLSRARQSSERFPVVDLCQTLAVWNCTSICRMFLFYHNRSISRCVWFVFYYYYYWGE